MNNKVAEDKGTVLEDSIIEVVNDKSRTRLKITPIITTKVSDNGDATYVYNILFETMNPRNKANPVLSKNIRLFNLESYNGSILSNLMKFIEPVAKKYPDYKTLLKNIPIFNNKLRFFNAIKKNMSYKDNSKIDFDYSNTIKLLAVINTAYDMGTTSEIVEEFLKEYPSYDSIVSYDGDFKKFFYPAFYNLSTDEIDFGITYINNFSKKFKSIEAFKIAYKICMLLCSEDDRNSDDVLLKNAVVDNYDKNNVENYVFKLSIINCLIMSDELCDFINNLTVKDLKKVVDEISDYNFSVSLDNVKEIINFEPVSFMEYFDALNTVISLGKKFNYNDDKLKNLYSRLNNYYSDSLDWSYKLIMKLFFEYLNSSNGFDETTYKLIYSFIDDKWYSYNNIDFINFINNYRNIKMIGFGNYLSLISDLKKCEKYLSDDEWSNYVINFDEYKSLPVSWWLELV